MAECKTRNCKREPWSPIGVLCIKHEKKARAEAAEAPAENEAGDSA